MECLASTRMRLETDTISVYAVQRQLPHFRKAENNLTTGIHSNYVIKMTERRSWIRLWL
jgi:hypothetical protein